MFFEPAGSFMDDFVRAEASAREFDYWKDYFWVRCIRTLRDLDPLSYSSRVSWELNMRERRFEFLFVVIFSDVLVKVPVRSLLEKDFVADRDVLVALSCESQEL